MASYERSIFSIFPHYSILVALACLLGMPHAEIFAQPPKLSAVKIRFLNTKLVPALAAGSQTDSFKLTAQLFASASTEEVKLIDDFLTARQFPKASKLYIDEALFQIKNGSIQEPISSALMPIIETRLTDEINQRIASIEKDSAALASEDLPKAWQEIDDFFQRFQVLQQELDTVANIGNFARRSQITFNATGPSVNEKLEKLGPIKIQLIKREAKFRTQQVESSSATLETATDFHSQFVAASQMNNAKQFFEHFFSTNWNLFADQVLAETFKAKIRETIATAESQHTAVFEKSKVLREGLQWWLRGRYGAGRQAAGLLKPASATKHPETMFGLEMPKTRPTPTSRISFTPMAAVANSPEYFERRHHYNWIIGHRERFSEGTAGQVKSVFVPQQTETVTGQGPCGSGCQVVTTRYPERHLQYVSYVENIFDDQNIVPRLVGSFEYWNSLQSLERLVKISNSKEIEVYDNLISFRPEFSFHIGLAKAYGGDEISFDAKRIVFSNSAAQPQGAQNNPTAGKSTRSGLAWLMALARVELSASLSAYTDLENPFVKIPPTDFDRRQYEAIVFDDGLFHLQALNNDRDFQEISRKTKKASLLTLDYWRRLKLTQDLLAFAAESQFNNSQSSEYLASARKILNRKAKNMYTNISIEIFDVVQRQEQAVKYLHERTRGSGQVIDTRSCADFFIDGH